jgi:hypothetical protein
MSEMDYPRAFVSFPRIAGSGNEIALWAIKFLLQIYMELTEYDTPKSEEVGSPSRHAL